MEDLWCDLQTQLIEYFHFRLPKLLLTTSSLYFYFCSFLKSSLKLQLLRQECSFSLAAFSSIGRIHRQLLWCFFGVTFGLCHNSCKDKLIGLSGWSQMLLALMSHQFSLKMKSWANLGSQETFADDLFMIKRQHNFLMSICFLWNFFWCPQKWCFL